MPCGKGSRKWIRKEAQRRGGREGGNATPKRMRPTDATSLPFSATALAKTGTEENRAVPFYHWPNPTGSSADSLLGKYLTALNYGWIGLLLVALTACTSWLKE